MRFQILWFRKLLLSLGDLSGLGTMRCAAKHMILVSFCWPTAKYAVMGGDSAAGTLVEIKIRQLERSGKVLSEEDKKNCTNPSSNRTTSRRIRDTEQPGSGLTASSTQWRPGTR